VETNSIQIVVDTLRRKGKLFKKMQEVAPKELGIRNRIKIYQATDTYGYFWAIFAISQKSRILMKDVHKFEEIYAKLTLYCDHNFKHKVIFIDAPLCSKAQKALKEAHWKIQ